MAQFDNHSISSETALQGRDTETVERHTLLRETVSSLLRDAGGVGRVRGLRGRPPGFDRRTWKQMADLGWLAIPVPEDAGGLGLGIRDMCIVAHEMGKWLAPEPLVASTALVTGVLWRGDSHALKGDLLAQVMAGKVCIALAWQESVGDLDSSVAKHTHAKRHDGGITLDGRKCFVHGGSDGFIVSASGEDGFGLYWVPAAAKGLTATPVQLADGSFATDLTLDDVHIAPDSVVALGEAALSAVRAAIDEALVVMSAELLGVMEAVLQQTLEYLRTRVQFGRPIGEFQALQHRSVDLFLAKELASCALHDAIETFEFDENVERRAEAAMRVKFRTSRSAMAITRAAVHLHGAMGFTDECDIGMHLKRAIVLNSWLGNNDQQLQKLSNQIGWLSRAWH